MPTRTRFLGGKIFSSLKPTHHFEASHLCKKSRRFSRIKVPTSIENNGDEQQHLCAALR